MTWQRHVFDVDPEVWVDVKRVDARWSADSLYVGPFGRPDNQPGKYASVGEWLSKIEFLEMPWMRYDPSENTISFVDGRHRFAWLRDHGAKAILVTVPPADLPLMTKLFGTSLVSTTYNRRTVARGQAD